MTADQLREKVREFSSRDAWTAGREFFEREAAKEPRGAAARAGLGFFCLKETRYDTRRAASELAEALRLDKKLPLVHVYLAILFACLEDAPAARAAAVEARRRGAREADAVMAEAYVELDTGSLDKAVALFRRLADLEPGSTTQILLSQALSQAGSNAAALACARAAAALDPEDFRAFAYAGVYLSYLRRFDEAGRELGKAARMNPAYAMTHHALACAARAQGKDADAERHLRKALEVDEHYVTSRKLLADLCAASGRKDEARAHYRRALAQFPLWKDVRRALDALNAG